MKSFLFLLSVVLCLLFSCKNESNTNFKGSDNEDSIFVPIEGLITFKFKTEEDLNLVISRLNHQNKYCSVQLYLEYKKKVIDKIDLQKLFKECNPQVGLKQDFESITSVVFPDAKTEVGLITFKLDDGSTYDLLVGQSNRKLLKLEDPIEFASDQLVENTLIVKDTSLIYNSKIINKNGNTEFSNTTKILEVLGDGLLKEQKVFPITKNIFSYTFKMNPSYSYKIEESQYNWRERVYHSVLYKDDNRVDANVLKSPEDYMETLFSINEVKGAYTDISIGNVEALVEITNKDLGETWDGYGYNNMLFGYTSNNKLVNELFTYSSGGNTESDFSHSYIADELFNIPNAKAGFNDRIIINKIGNETFYNPDDNDHEGKTTELYNIQEVYDYKNETFTKDVITGYAAYVTSKTGLSVRKKPGFTERLEKLDYQTKVRIIARSKIDLELKEANNKTVIGRWCKILYNNNKKGYVFDGYLSKVEPE